MSWLGIDKKNSSQDENKINFNSNNEGNSNTVIDMDKVQEDVQQKAKQGELMIADSNDLLCTDIKNSIEPPANKNEEILIDVEKEDFKELKNSVINTERSVIRIYTGMGFRDQVFGSPQQDTGPGRFTRQVWRQEPPPSQPQQTIWTQFTSPGTRQGLSGDGEGYGAYGYAGGGPLMYDPQSRNSFVALVMGIVFVMLVATAGFIAVVLATPDLKLFFRRSGLMLLIPAMIAVIGVNYALICLPAARRPPCNFICLIITTAGMSVLAAKVTTLYRTEIVLYAVIATAAVVFVCLLLACSKFDFTSYMLYIIGISIAFSVIVMIIIITTMLTGTMMKPLLIAILFISTLIQIVLLTMELQMILGGRTVEISEADYALAAFLLYTSIIDIFLKLVHILGLLSN